MLAAANQTLTVVPNAKTFAESSQHQFAGFGGVGPYQFSSSNPEVLSITESGLMQAKTKGEAFVTIIDSQGNEATSKTIYVGRSKEKGGNNACPFKNQQFCQIFCRYKPELPWCSSQGHNLSSLSPVF